MNKIIDGIQYPLSESDITDIADKEAKWLVIKSYQDSISYLNNRLSEYPSIQDQLLMLWSSMDTGEIPKSKAFYDAISAVNAKYPQS